MQIIACHHFKGACFAFQKRRMFFVTSLEILRLFLFGCDFILLLCLVTNEVCAPFPEFWPETRSDRGVRAPFLAPGHYLDMGSLYNITNANDTYIYMYVSTIYLYIYI